MGQIPVPPIQPESSPTNQQEILLAIKAALTDGKINDLTEDDVTISASMDPPAGMRRYFHVVLWVVGGEFDEQAFVGAGIQGVHEYAGVSVTIWRQHFEDRTGQAPALLMHDDTGLLVMKGKILKRLCESERLQYKGKFLLINEMRPTRSNHEDSQSESGKPGQAYLEFATPFRWNLTP
jgi:hypothetical protein